MPGRLQAIAPEALAFAVIGLANTLLYIVIYNVAFMIGAVKATVIATVITTALSYLAHRHWTYKARPKTGHHREGTLFFAFNLAGMVIQAGVVAVTKYGFDLSERDHRLVLNLALCVGVVLATAFRFWSYRTLVFRAAPQESELVADVAAATMLAQPMAEVEALAEAEHLVEELDHLVHELESEPAHR